MRVPALLLIVAVALGVLPFSPRTARADDEASTVPEVTEMLVVGRVSRGGRVAVFQDAMNL